MNLVEKVRNIGIMAQADAGKTTTTERILHYTIGIHRVGEAHDGAFTMDFLEQERERAITTIQPATYCLWKDSPINIIDTPNPTDFTVGGERILRILDGAVAVFDGTIGIDPQTENIWREADKYSVPRICFINKMANLGADFNMCIDSIKDRLAVTPLPLQLPIGEGSNYTGIIDLVEDKAIRWVGDEDDTDYIAEDISESLMNKYKSARMEMLAILADYSEEIADLYLEGNQDLITPEMIKKAIRYGTIHLQFFPVICGTAFKHKGVTKLLDAIVDYLPSPIDLPEIKGYSLSEEDEEGEPKILIKKRTEEESFVALAFNVVSDPHGTLTFARIYSGSIKSGTTVFNSTCMKKERIGRIVRIYGNKREDVRQANAGDIVAFIGLKTTSTGDTLCVDDGEMGILLEKIVFPEAIISMAIEPSDVKDRNKMAIGLGKLAAEDSSLAISFNEESGQTIISGISELHLEIVLDRLKREYKVNVKQGYPQISYRETIDEYVQLDHGYTHKKQSGGAGQYAQIKAKIRRNKDSNELKFINRIVGGSIPQEYIPGVEKGLIESMKVGVIAGYPVVGIEVELYDGSFHDVDSSVLAFEICAHNWFAEAMHILENEKKNYLIEPIMKVEVNTPMEYQGSIAGSLSSRRGSITDTELLRGNSVIVKADVPFAEMLGYIQTLRGMTQGRATFSMTFGFYEKVPSNVQDSLRNNL